MSKWLDRAWKEFGQPAGTEPSLFLQWKGITGCADYHCPCGHSAHLCDEQSRFMYVIQCSKCRRAFAVSPFQKLVELTKEELETRPDPPRPVVF